MTKTLIVTKPFYTLDAGDTFELSKDGDYVASYSESMGNSIDDGAEIYGNYTSRLTISKAYAEELVQDGYLKEESENKGNNFVNVFTEIDTLLNKYKSELKTIDEDFKDAPQCVKVEKATVLDNMITVLDHLKNLKK